MLELLDALGRERPCGSATTGAARWCGASPATTRTRCHGVANLCVPYLPDGFTLETLVPLVDRDVYPAAEYPVGQWDYLLFYREHFDDARAAFEADVARDGQGAVPARDTGGGRRTVADRVDRGSTAAGSAEAAPAPDLPMDTSVLDQASFETYVAGLRRNGFYGPDSWYVNDEGNGAYAATAVDGGRLSMPVLFLHARYDVVCATVGTRLSEPMRHACGRLTEVVVDSGHWMSQEQPDAVNAALDGWLASIGLAPRSS